MSDPQWWVPTSLLSARTRRAHLLPPDSNGGRGQALCGEGRIGWVLNTFVGISHCRTCQTIAGMAPPGESPTRKPSRRVGLVAADYCTRRRLGKQELGELLDMLLEHRAEARR